MIAHGVDLRTAGIWGGSASGRVGYECHPRSYVAVFGRYEIAQADHGGALVDKREREDEGDAFTSLGHHRDVFGMEEALHDLCGTRCHAQCRSRLTS